MYLMARITCSIYRRDNDVSHPRRFVSSQFHWMGLAMVLELIATLPSKHQR